ncbi:MAG: PVC-type heme-binding CxxCH protein [Planctomycetia bacterium]|mgnify:CR=1 FL=1|nr:PVC-type heme-binding CxxCH protein [Planctomycetia bacterium]
MRCLVALVLVGLMVEPLAAQDLVAPTEALSAAEQLAKFHLPPGFEIQLVAAEPEIFKPINLAWDAAGRMLVTHSLEYPYPAGKDQPHRDAVEILEDTNGDGRADRFTRFADQLNIPIGVTALPDAVMYYSIPSIRRAVDRDGDGKADETQELYREFGYRDTHGMGSSFRPWIDGWIYCCHGYANTSTLTDLNGNSITMNSGNTFRIRADGSRIEQWTHGQVNPFGLAFDPLGNLYSSDCHSLPAYMLLRGAYYPSFGKPHDGLGYGPTMINHDHGSTGIAGISYYAADHFPPKYRDTLFIGNPVTGRVNHDHLEQHGSTYQAIEQPDFISCDDPWFRPVDVQVGPDGALYIADFYNCIIGHYEVPLTHPRRDRFRGRIWRVVYKGTDGQSPVPRSVPDLPRASNDELVALLADPNLWVRCQATEQLVSRKLDEDALWQFELLSRGNAPAEQRVHAMWVIERSAPQGCEAELLGLLANDTAREVRVHVMKLLAERPEWASQDMAMLARGGLEDDDAFVQRAAADALGRHPAKANLKPLLAAWKLADSQDTHLIHVVRMALRDHLLAPGMYVLAASLAQDPEAAARFAELSLGTPTAGAADYLLQWCAQQYAAGQLHGGTHADYLHQLVRYAADERLDAALRLIAELEVSSTDSQRGAIAATFRACSERGHDVPEAFQSWGARLTRTLLSQPDTAAQGVELARELRSASVHEALSHVCGDAALEPALRAAALDACAAIDAGKTLELAKRLLTNSDEPITVRERAALAIAAANDVAGRELLATSLASAPERLSKAMALALVLSPEGSKLLLMNIAAGKASATLLQEPVIESQLRNHNLPDFAARLSKLTENIPARDERVNQLIAARLAAFDQQPHDAALGKQLFTKHCAACHRLEDQGNKVGPDLAGVGLRGAERLLEDTLDPNRNVDQAFRATIINTTAGQPLTGLVLREEGQVLIFVDSQGKEQRIDVEDIEERAQVGLSPMPANVAELIPETEFYHLLAYLLSQRQSPP